MKTILPGVLVGVGGIGAVATTVGVVYPINRSNKDVIDDAIFDAKFSDLRTKIRNFAEKCEDKGKQYGDKTVLEELKDIFGMLLEQEVEYSGGVVSNLGARKYFLEKRLTEGENKLFKDLYEKFKGFSKQLQDNRRKSSEYIEKLKQN